MGWPVEMGGRSGDKSIGKSLDKLNPEPVFIFLQGQWSGTVAYQEQYGGVAHTVREKPLCLSFQKMSWLPLRGSSKQRPSPCSIWKSGSPGLAQEIMRWGPDLGTTSTCLDLVSKKDLMVDTWYTYGFEQPRAGQMRAVCLVCLWCWLCHWSGGLSSYTPTTLFFPLDENRMGWEGAWDIPSSGSSHSAQFFWGGSN